jgi:hypothetical protein
LYKSISKVLVVKCTNDKLTKEAEKKERKKKIEKGV